MHLQVEDSAHEIETMLQLPDSTYVHGSIPLQGKDVRIGFKAIRDLKGDCRRKAYKLPLSEVDVKEMIGHAQLTEVASGHQKSNPPGMSWNLAKVVLPKQLAIFEFAEVLESIRANLTPFSARVTATFHHIKIYEYMEYAREFTMESAQPGESHFGTLAVQLPYHHTGGDLGFGFPSIKYFQFAKEFDPTTIDTHPLQWVAWHNGQAHQRTSIESGYQILIIYRLFREGFVSPTPLPPSPHLLMKELCKLAEGPFEDIQPQGLVILLKHRYSFANVRGFDGENIPMNREKEKTNQTDFNPRMPLLLGSDAVVYQMFRSLGLKPTCRVIYEQLKVPFIAFQDKPQKNCCWVPDAPVTNVQDFELETPNRLSPTVIYIKAGAMPLQDDNISNHPACLSCRNETGFTHTPSLTYLLQHVGLLVSLPCLWIRRRPAILLAYDENDNILKLLRLHSTFLFQMIVQLI